ncbi:MAG: hypothetical protein AB7S48_08905 [Bacteroidales bacterium]
MLKQILIFLSFIFFIPSISNAQIEQLENICSLYFPPEYITDGQEYFAPLKPDQKIEFRTTFFSDNTYRIVACTNLRKGKLVFSVYDTDKNLLFTNESFDYSPFWDLKFTSTVTCVIQVDVKSSKFTPGYVMLLIGFKQ